MEESINNIKSQFTLSSSQKRSENQFLISDSALMKIIIDNLKDVIVLIDVHRNIFFYNKNFVDLVNYGEAATYEGMKLGQAFSCAHALETPTGCGTTESCALCGLTKSISRIHKEINTEETRILNNGKGEVLDLKISSSPFVYNNENYIVLIISDIKHEKRRRILERIFFHDIMNTAAGLKGLSELLKDSDSIDEMQELSQLVFLASLELVEEIQSQKILSAAESDEIVVSIEVINLKSFLNKLINFYSAYEVAKDKNLVFDTSSRDIILNNDPALLRRVAGNMIKNALEEIKPGEEVTIGCNSIGGNNVEIWVHNPGYMKREIQLQIFQRSFSTKGQDRGLGTYSMKMLSEKYLKGKIGFITSEINGTKFSLILDSQD